jgi:hypothetical protein
MCSQERDGRSLPVRVLAHAEAMASHAAERAVAKALWAIHCTPYTALYRAVAWIALSSV